MRRRIATYTITGSVISLQESVKLPDVRLIFDETSSECICSSSQKGKIFVPTDGRSIFILDGVSRTGHDLTIEIDNGSSLEGVENSVSGNINTQTEQITSSINQQATNNKEAILSAIQEVKDGQYHPAFANNADIENMFDNE